MTYLRRSIVVVSCLVVVCSVLACSGVKQALQDVADILTLGTLYSEFASAHNNKGPASEDEWEKWATEKSKPAEQIALIKETKGGKYTFYWGVEFDKITTPKEDTVLGYETKIPTLAAGEKGNVVMCAPNTQKQMSADELKAATKPPGVK